MKFPALAAVLLLAFTACSADQKQNDSQLSNAERPVFVQDLSAFHRQYCPAGYEQFAYDGTSDIYYCVQYASGTPEVAVKRLTGDQKIGVCSGCSTTMEYVRPCQYAFQPELNDAGQRAVRGTRFAFDGTAGIDFCMLKNRVRIGDPYITQVSANLGQDCPANWKQFVWNGRSNISFCYQDTIRNF